MDDSEYTEGKGGERVLLSQERDPTSGKVGHGHSQPSISVLKFYVLRNKILW